MSMGGGSNDEFRIAVASGAAAMSDALDDVPTAHGARRVVLHGDSGLCGPLRDAFCSDGRLSAADIAYVGGTEDPATRVGDPTVAAVVLVGAAADTAGLVERVAELRRHQADPLIPIFVRSTAHLPPAVRAGLRALGVYGPCCREGVDAAALVDDVLYAIESMHEKRALIAISTFAGNKESKSSLTELAVSALAFLRANGIGTAGGLFCFFRPTSAPEWMVVAGTGRFAAADRLPAAALAPPLRALIEGEDDGAKEYCDANDLMLRFVTAEGSRLCLYLAQNAPLAAWHRIVARIFRTRLAVVVDEVMQRRRIERTQHASIATLATVSEYRDVDTGNHVSRVSRIATEVAQILIDRGGVDDGDAELLRHIGHASILHDIGKVGIPDAILLKPGPLDADERSIMQTHTDLGHEILNKTAMASDWPTVMTLAATVARSHHERYDGTGYPDGLAGAAIPLAARIVAVVDVFDALTGERPYKQPWPEEQAIGFVCEQSGRHFDPQVVEAFVAVVRRSDDRAAVTWSERFSVGHEGIDRDHQKLFAILNRLWLDKRGGDRLIVEMALDDLMHYTRNHFAREEDYMIYFGYPGHLEHCKAHESFAAQIESLRWEYLHGLRSDIHSELLDYLWHWLIDHIAEADKMYSRFIAALGAGSRDADELKCASA